MHGKPHDYLGDTAETAKYIHKDRRTLIRWRGEGTGPPFIKAGHHVLYKKEDVDAWLESHRVVPVRDKVA